MTDDQKRAIDGLNYDASGKHSRCDPEDDRAVLAAWGRLSVEETQEVFLAPDSWAAKPPSP